LNTEAHDDCLTLFDGTWSWHVRDGAFTIRSHRQSTFGLPKSELPTEFTDWLDLVHPRDQQQFRDMLEPGDTAPRQFLARVQQSSGGYGWVLLRGQPKTDHNGDHYLEGGFLELTAIKQAQENLLLASRILECTPEGVLITDADHRIIDVNPAFERTTGYSREEALGKNPSMLSSGRHDDRFYQDMWRQLNENGHWQGEIWNRRKSGELYPELLNLVRITNADGTITNYVGIFSDITSDAEIRRQLHELAYYDPLTKLPNRVLFQDRLRVALEQANRGEHRVGVIFIDLDKFKQVNDSLGHSHGDLLLTEMAKRLSRNCRKSDTVARLGGDEFAVIMPNLPEPDHAAVLAEKLNESLKPAFTLDGAELLVQASFGISLFPQDGADMDTLLKHADMAMYHAKSSGRYNIQFFQHELGRKFRRSLDLQSELRKAIENDDLQLAYQPQVALPQHEIVGVEALLRWTHPDMGRISPQEFIPIAEESGLICALGDWVIDRGLRDAAAWNRICPRPIRLGINISGEQIKNGILTAHLRQLFSRPGNLAGNLELELTETVLMDDIDATIRQLRAMEDLGIQIAIDDFGTGYSSLNYIKRFPLHRLKIDQSFVRDILGDSHNKAIISTIIAMGQTLSFDITAEGVETGEQLEFLQSMGCDEVQGFLFSPAVGFDDILRLMSEQQCRLTPNHPETLAP